MSASADRFGHGVSYRFTVAKRHKVAEHDTPGKRRHRGKPDVDGEPRLADTAGTDDRHRVVFLEKREHVVQLSFASDESVGFDGQFLGTSDPTPQRAIVDDQVLAEHHVDGLGAYPLELMLTHGACLDVAKERGNRRGCNDLIAVGDVHDPGGTTDGSAVVVSARRLRFAHMNTDAHLEPIAVFPVCLLQVPLNGDRTVDRIDRRTKDRPQAISGVFEDHAIVVGDSGREDLVVVSEGPPHVVGLGLPTSRARFDIGEQECENARRQLCTVLGS